MIDIAKANKDFDDFIFAMDSQLEALDDEARKRGIPLDLTLDSLENVESLFFQLADTADEETRESLIATFARYVGEIVRLSCGGEWELSLEDPKKCFTIRQSLSITPKYLAQSSHLLTALMDT